MLINFLTGGVLSVCNKVKIIIIIINFLTDYYYYSIAITYVCSHNLTFVSCRHLKRQTLATGKQWNVNGRRRSREY